MEIVTKALEFIGEGIKTIATDVFEFFVDNVESVMSTAMNFVSDLIGF